MKIGIIIVFHNDENKINTNQIIETVHKLNDIELCLVDNYSNDNTLQLLKEIKENCLEKTSVVEVKKYVSNTMAVRAGERYIYSACNIKHIGYINVSSIKNSDLVSIIEKVYKDKEKLITYSITEAKKTKATLFKRVFSVLKYLSKKRQIASLV